MDETQGVVSNGIPLPVVRLNRWLLLTGVILAFILQQPWVIAALLVMLLSAITLGPRGSLPFQAAFRLIPDRIREATQRGDVEDRRLMRFNNSIAAILLTLSLVSFGVGAPVIGWIFAGMVALASAIALCGFCFGCFIFYRFRLAQVQWRSN
ncbi:MAG TPA: DUF4395 domain-containing protein [Thermomicrobiales bacterium]|nr:DUF4395 domain-containing protein [Thermomicrobiales bacterium]